MKTLPRQLLCLTAVLASLGVILCRSALATTLTVANASFENPPLTDTATAANPSYVAQGGYGWDFDSNNSGIVNPGANEYTTAGGNGTPTGANGAQVGFVSRINGGAEMHQLLAGSDGIIGNSDDPVVMPATLYTLTVGVGRSNSRALFFGYDIQLFARNGAQDAIIGEVQGDSNSVAMGTFKDITLMLDTSSIPSFFYGQAIGIRLLAPFTPIISGLNSVTSYDNVRLTAVQVPEPNSLLLLCIGAVSCFVVATKRSAALQH